MATASVMRVEAGGAGYGGHAQSFAGHAESKRRKLRALFEAIDQSDLVLASQVFAALMNLEPALRDDSQWRALGCALQEGQLHVAQHFMNALQERVLHGAVHTVQKATPPAAAHPHYLDPEHGLCINIQA